LKEVEEPQPDSTVTKPCRGRATSAVAMRASPADPQLFERLRQLRTELAEEEGVSAFVIFHDKTLKAIAGYKPLTPAALMEIPGIGSLKAERYGRRVLQVVNGDA
jgi:ATP-dependent DNA helicase RecQ